MSTVHGKWDEAGWGGGRGAEDSPPPLVDLLFPSLLSSMMFGMLVGPSRDGGDVALLRKCFVIP
jgi:hypothetical protein